MCSSDLKYEAYDVLLDVLPGVEAYGQLLVPRNVKGRAPLVICEHGIGGKPWSTTGIGGDPKPEVYHQFATRLAERGRSEPVAFLKLATQCSQ